MTHPVVILPWPIYSDSGREITWEVRVEVPKFSGTLRWSTAAGRFHKDNHMFRLRRGSPKVFRQAIQTMVDFCAKAVTVNRQLVTELSEPVTFKVVTFSCARGGYALSHECHSDSSSCDSDILRDSQSQTGSLRDPSGEVA